MEFGILLPQKPKTREAEEVGLRDDFEAQEDETDLSDESLHGGCKRRNNAFPQLGDFASFDLIYKRALLVAHADTGDKTFDNEDRSENDYDNQAIGVGRRNDWPFGGGILPNASRSGN